MNYTTKDSGERQTFDTGMVRDIQTGKPRYDLLPVEVLTRDAELLARGAVKYGDHNWKLGQPFSRAYASTLRHIYQWASGDRSEDHLAAVRFGAMTLMYYEEKILAGELTSELDDMDVLPMCHDDVVDLTDYGVTFDCGEDEECHDGWEEVEVDGEKWKLQPFREYESVFEAPTWSEISDAGCQSDGYCGIGCAACHNVRRRAVGDFVPTNIPTGPDSPPHVQPSCKDYSNSTLTSEV